MIRYGLILGAMSTLACVTTTTQVPYEPVCSTDWKTYIHGNSSNTKEEKDLDLAVAHRGTCQPEETKHEETFVAECPTGVTEVCGTDGVTYINACMLNHAFTSEKSVTLKHFGSCKNNTDTELIHNPSDTNNDNSEVFNNTTLVEDAKEYFIEVNDEDKVLKTVEEDILEVTAVEKSQDVDQVEKQENLSDDMESANMTKNEFASETNIVKENRPDTHVIKNNNDMSNEQRMSKPLNEPYMKRDQNTSDAQNLELNIEGSEETSVVQDSGEGAQNKHEGQNQSDLAKNSENSEDSTIKSEKLTMTHSAQQPADINDSLKQNHSHINPTEKSKYAKNKSGKFQKQKNSHEIVANEEIESLGQSNDYRKSRKRRNVQSMSEANSNETQNESEINQRRAKHQKSKTNHHVQDISSNVDNVQAEIEEMSNDELQKDDINENSVFSRKQRDIKYKKIIDTGLSGKVKTHTRPEKITACPCTKELRQVCGTNGVTYANPCLLKCDAKSNKKIQLKFEGPCEANVRNTRSAKSCLCIKEYKPVCSENGITFQNKCEMKCAGEKKGHKGACRAF